MIISISGTPGAGKTAVSKILARMMKANVISITEQAKKIPHGYDKKRRTKIIDIRILQKKINKEITSNNINIIDGHMSHLLKSDIVIIFRCNPKVLKERMKNRKWNATKIRENIEAEILDEITIEALKKSKNVFEIDTSRKSAKKTAEIAKNIILNKYYARKKNRAGLIDWTRKYRDILCHS